MTLILSSSPTAIKSPLPYERYPYLSLEKKAQLKHKRFVLCCVYLSGIVLISALHKDSQFILGRDLANLQKDINQTPKLSILNHKKSLPQKGLVNLEFLSLLKKTEGFSSQFYYDNKGIAAAYGWNITKNTPEFNRRVAYAAGLPTKEVKTIVAYSQKNVRTIPIALARIEIDEKKANRSIDFLYDFYFQEFKNVFSQKIKSDDKEKILKRLTSNFNKKQKAVFAHMAYKVGKSGLSQYDNFFTVLEKTLSKNQVDKQDIKALQKEIVYSYQSRSGEKRYDEKVQMLHRAEFGPTIKVADNQTPGSKMRF